MAISETQHEMAALRRSLEGLVGIPASEGNAVDVLRNGDEIFPAMLDAIAAAEHTVDILTFVYWTGEIAQRFADALAEKAASGVRVRVLLDALGAREMDRSLIERMTAAGAIVEWFRPISTVRLSRNMHRTHRKVLICDEQVAFTGGVGIAEEWCGDARDSSEWRDTHVRVRGPAVDGLRAAFVGNWAETGRPILDEHDRFPTQPQVGDATVQVVRGSAKVGWSDIAVAVYAAVSAARRTVRITSAYFSPDAVFAGLLTTAAKRGVDVQVLVPGPHADKRVAQLAGEDLYEPLLKAGVKIWCFQPTMMHAKVLTVDGHLACIGSANFNSRSLSLDEEVDLAIFHEPTTALLDRHFEDDLARSRVLDVERWKRRPLRQRTMETLTKVLRRGL